MPAVAKVSKAAQKRAAQDAKAKKEALEREQKAAAILAIIHDGFSLRTACEKVGVKAPTFVLWCSQNNDLAEQYAQARVACIDKIADDTIRIADEPVGTLINGGTDSGAVNKQRLQVDTRKWLLSKLAPKRFGDKLALVGGDDDDNPIRQSVDISPADAYKKMLNG